MLYYCNIGDVVIVEYCNVVLLILFNLQCAYDRVHSAGFMAVDAQAPVEHGLVRSIVILVLTENPFMTTMAM